VAAGLARKLRTSSAAARSCVMSTEPDLNEVLARLPAGEELRAVLAASRIGTWRWDVATGEVLWDTTLEELSGLPPGGFGGTFEAWLETLHPDEVDGILEEVNRAIEARDSYHFEHRTAQSDGSERWLECRGRALSGPDGEFIGTVGCAVDATARHRIERERTVALDRERRSRERFEFLSQLTEAAMAATDHSAFMHAAAAAAVPKLGDWCSIHFVPEPGSEVETVVAHSDPERVQ